MIAMAAPLDLSQWKYRKRIPLTPGEGLAVVKLDREVYVGSQPAQEDIRVFRDSAEVPYILETLQFEGDHREHAEKLLDLSVVNDSDLQFTISAGRSLHNRVTIRTEERNFRQKVRIEAGDDNRRWSILRSDGAIFDFTQDGLQLSSLSLDFPVSTKPYLRVTVRGWNKASYLVGAYLDHEIVRPTMRETLATLIPQPVEDPQTQSTMAILDLGVVGLPVDRIVFETASQQFQRAVGVEVTHDGKDWSYLGQGVISRVPGNGFTEESLGFTIRETHSRYLRIRIYNRDDQPIKVTRIQLEGLIHRVRFLAPSTGNYWLYYGNSKVRAPEYDLPILLSRREPATEAQWTLGAAEPNPLYRPPPTPKKPWSEQHPAILYTVLGVAVLALGIATFRFAARLRTTA